MKKKWKTFMTLFGLFFVIGTLSGCSMSTKDEKEILEDFIEKRDDLSFLDFETLTINKRQTNKEKKEDKVYATVEGTGEYAKHSYDCVFLYNYYEKGGWILDDLKTEACSLSDIQRRSDDEVLKDFEADSSSSHYFPGPYSTVTGEIQSVFEPELDEPVSLGTNDNAEAYDKGEGFGVVGEMPGDNNEGGFFSDISCQYDIVYDLSYDSTISYFSYGIYHLTEFYNPNNGEWEDNMSGWYDILNQGIYNVDNIIFISEPNKHGYYRIGYLEPTDTCAFSWYEKSFDNENQELIFEKEEPYKVEGGFLRAYDIGGVDLISGYNQYLGAYLYYEDGVEYSDRTDEGCQMVINWDSGEVYETRSNRNFSILNTNGEYPTGNFAEGNPLDTRKGLGF